MKKHLTVIDFFCGAGGFSEGFRQQGFKVVRGIDNWKPAIDTHNLNHNLNDEVCDVLDFWNEDTSEITEIEKLEDTDVLIGSPSCVSFSMSNRAGKADKADGLRLIEAYLRVVAVKKHKKNSSLKVWYMENVPKSQEFIRKIYTFENLNLTNWAKHNGYKKTDIALKIQGAVLNAGDYGAPQNRKRFISGEWVSTGEFLVPQKTSEVHKSVSELRVKMPKVSESRKSRKKFSDPNYPDSKYLVSQITDHFYDTGVYKIEWEKAQFLKTNHPFMGKMSFPENENKTSRTIMATRSASTREALLYKSEYKRIGDGEYRLPTIREAASLMGFPYSYQFFGSEGTKWRLIGNSVCPHQSSALAKEILKKMKIKIVPDKEIDFKTLEANVGHVNNLNTFKEKSFDKPRGRQANPKFRRHVLKLGNMTVDLMNYHPSGQGEVAKNWYVVNYFGTGEGYGVKIFTSDDKNKIEVILKDSVLHFDEYRNNLLKMSVSQAELQHSYEKDLHLELKSNPVLLLKELSELIIKYENHDKPVESRKIFKKKEAPLCQLMSAYGLLTILNY